MISSQVSLQWIEFIFGYVFIPVDNPLTLKSFFYRLVSFNFPLSLLQNYISQFAGVIRTALESTPNCDILDVKAAVWALGHIGSAIGGLDLLMEEKVLDDLVKLAESCPILSIRG